MTNQITKEITTLGFDKQKLLLLKLPEILNSLGVSYREYENRYSFSCPIHESKRQESLSVFKHIGNYVCWTQHCEEENKSLDSVVEALLKRCRVDKSIEQLLDEQLQKANIDEITQQLITLNKPQEAREEIVYPREVYLKNVKIPSGYFISRGFQVKTLRKFEIGFCMKRGSAMFMRSTVPVYDVNKKHIIGILGRTVNSECPMCNRFHYKNHSCPSTPFEEYKASKWINSKGFKSGYYLYNSWNIKATRPETCIIVEGQGDVWKLDEAGIYNSVSTFSNKISSSQIDTLLELGIVNVILAYNNDEEGIKGAERAEKRLKRLFNTTKIFPPEKDFGEMSTNEIKKFMKEYQ